MILGFSLFCMTYQIGNITAIAIYVWHSVELMADLEKISQSLFQNIFGKTKQFKRWFSQSASSHSLVAG